MAIKIFGGRLEGLLTGVSVSGRGAPDVEIFGTHISGLTGVSIDDGTSSSKPPFDIPEELLTSFLIRNDIRKKQGREDIEKAAEESGLLEWLKEHGVELSAFLLQVGILLAPK